MSRCILRILKVLLCSVGLFTLQIGKAQQLENYASPTRLIYSEQRNILYVCLSTSKEIAIVDTKTHQTKETVNLGFFPVDIALDRRRNEILILEKGGKNRLHWYNAETYKLIRTLKLKNVPYAIAVSDNGEYASVCFRFANKIGIVNLEEKKIVECLAMEREPVTVKFGKGISSIMASTNLLPVGRGDDANLSAKVSLFDLKNNNRWNIALPGGSHSPRGLAFSHSNEYLFVTHILARNHLPTTQLQKGWMNTNALSIIDIKQKKLCATLLLDDFNKGAANPTDIKLTANDSLMFIAISGTHELIRIEVQSMIQRLKTYGDNEELLYSNLEDLSGDFLFLHGLKDRLALDGLSPNKVAVVGNNVVVSCYFSDNLEWMPIHATKNNLHEITTLGKTIPITKVRLGELLFSDARMCFQSWQSCTSCHPDARTDALNWDLMNDGKGNPKNNKSMLFAHFTPPAMATGIRKSAKIAVRAGIKYIQMAELNEENADAIDQYLMSLQPEPSPYLENGTLSDRGQRGKELFASSGCINCHSGKYFTNGRQYIVGTGGPDSKTIPLDTPTLKEVWRTAPYLCNGQAKTMEEVLVKYNKKDLHGTTSSLNTEELANLIEYVMSL